MYDVYIMYTYVPVCINVYQCVCVRACVHASYDAAFLTQHALQYLHSYIPGQQLKTS